MKEHTKTYGKYFIFLIKCIKNEQIEKTIHKILRKNIFTKIFYPKISYFNSTKTECYYYNDLINHSIDFLTNYINSFSMDMIDYELYYELKSKFHNTYQKLIEHNKIT